MADFPNPYDPDRLTGSVIKVSGAGVTINLPRAAAPKPRLHLGHSIHGGAVGEFVVVDCGHVAILGRIEAVRLPERDRLTVEERYSDRADAHPVGDVSLMASLNLADKEVSVGVSRHPRLGAQVFSAHPDLVKWAARRGASLEKPLAFASLVDDPEALVEVSPDSLFARHCAVVGSTGAGKSWTLARLMQDSIPLGYKLILLDSTGEFETLEDGKVFHCSLNKKGANERLARIPYTRLRVEDMFTLFRPGPQVQSIKLREAVRSLRVAKLEYGNGHALEKEGVRHADIAQLFAKHAQALESSLCDFDVSVLSVQIDLECVWPNGKYENADRFGGPDDGARGHCVSLTTRIESIVGEPTLGCLFKEQAGTYDFVDILDWFIGTKEPTILRLSLKHLPEAHNAPGVLVNALSRLLLRYAREDKFKKDPVVLVVDEAHRYMNRENTDDPSHRLDGLELVAKEGRKEGLYLLLSTQRPRDLGHGVLSQVGTIIAHRLTHPDDRSTVERAAGDFDANAASILAGLAPGQAVIIGVDFPVPVTVQVLEPAHKPNSSSPSLVVERDPPLPIVQCPFNPPAAGGAIQAEVAEEAPQPETPPVDDDDPFADE